MLLCQWSRCSVRTWVTRRLIEWFKLLVLKMIIVIIDSVVPVESMFSQDVGDAVFDRMIQTVSAWDDYCNHWLCRVSGVDVQPGRGWRGVWSNDWRCLQGDQSTSAACPPHQVQVHGSSQGDSSLFYLFIIYYMVYTHAKSFTVVKIH